MDSLKTIFDFCTNIMSINLDLFGYNITLLQVMVFSILGSIILKFLFSLKN